MWRDDRGVTTVEWLGMAFLAVLVVAFLIPQVRGSAGDLWDAVTAQLFGAG